MSRKAALERWAVNICAVMENLKKYALELWNCSFWLMNIPLKTRDLGTEKWDERYTLQGIRNMYPTSIKTKNAKVACSWSPVKGSRLVVMLTNLCREVQLGLFRIVVYFWARMFCISTRLCTKEDTDQCWTLAVFRLWHGWTWLWFKRRESFIKKTGAHFWFVRKHGFKYE